MITHTSPASRLQRLLELGMSGRAHPDCFLYAGLLAFEHHAVLNLLSENTQEAKRLHREFMALGFISPPATTSRGGKTIRVQFIYQDRIEHAVKPGRGDE